MKAVNEISGKELQARRGRRQRTAHPAAGDPPSPAEFPQREWWIERAPKTANAMLRSHWAAQRREVTTWEEELLKAEWLNGPWHSSHHDVPGPAKVSLEVLVLRRKLQDPDNAVASVKPVLDALKRRGWLFDDAGAWLRLEVEEMAAAVDRTVINWKLLPTTPTEDPMVKSKVSKRVKKAIASAGRKAPRKTKEKILERIVTVNGVHLAQARAFVQVCLKSAGVKAHLEAALGLGNVASVEDFESHD